MAEKFDPKKYLGSIQGRPYLDVAHRLLWLNEDAERFTIDTAIVEFDAEHAIVKAEVVILDAGGMPLRRATGYGSAYVKQLRGPIAGRWLEKAETAAIGRAVAALGYGTQYAQDFDDGEDDHLADTPIAPARQAQSAAPPIAAAAPGGRGTPPGALAGGDSYGCAICGNELEETKFRDGTTWTPAHLAGLGERKHGMPLCMQHYREANAAKTAGANRPPPEGVSETVVPAAPLAPTPIRGPRFVGGENERAQAFLTACRDELGLEMPAIHQMLGGKVGHYIALCKHNGEADASYDTVFPRLKAAVQDGTPIPFVAQEPVSEAVQHLQSDLTPTPA